MQTLQEAKEYLRDKYLNREEAICPCCNSEVVVRKESLSKGLVDTLVKFYLECRLYGTRELHLQDETDLTKNQYNNFQKLQYFELVEKTEKSGVWRITRAGIDFIETGKLIAKNAYVFRNKVIETTGALVGLTDYKKYIPEEYWNKIEKYNKPQRGLF